MKQRILIISPHFPPSNLAAVHRSRLFAQHLPAFGWEPIILTVDEQYYEEQLDWNLVRLLPPALRIEKARAFQVKKIRLVGDIGLRAFFQLYRKARTLIKQQGIDFLYIPIPSFYTALLGRWLHATTGIKYGIDYIDPWVHRFPGSDVRFSRHWWSTRLARPLQPEPDLLRDVEFHFIGSGKTPNDPEGYNIRPLAEKYGLWQTTVFEYPARIPYLDVLVHLDAADGVFVLGSTEPHYTPSKVYQAVLSGKPVAAVLHRESTAVKVIRRSCAGLVLDFDG